MAEFAPVPRAALDIVTGSRGPENIRSERVKIEMADKISSYMPDAAPLTTFTSRLRDKRTVENYRFDWLESDEYPRELELTANSAIADLTLSVTAGDEARVAANYVLMNQRTGEQVLVGSTSSGVVTVTRDIGGQGEADMVAGDVLVFTRPVYEDGADVGTSKSTKDVAKFNYTEIIRTPFSFTRRDAKTALFAGKDPMTERKKQAIEHKKSIEHAFFFGQRNAITGTHIRSFTGGLNYWIQSNQWDVTGVQVTERAFDEVLEEAMRWGSGGNQKGNGLKYLFASSRWITELNWFAKGKVEYRPLDETIGFGCMEYLSPHGRVRIIKTPILDYNNQGDAYLLDLNHIRYVAFDDTVLEKDRGGNGVDGSTEEYISDVGLQVELEAAHTRFKGLS